MKYKLTSNGKVIDVLDGATWATTSRRGFPIICGADHATGVISSNGNTIYSIVGTEGIPGSDIAVSVVDIDDAEYEKLYALLGLGADISDDGLETELPQEPEPEQEEISEDTTLEDVKRICIGRLSDACQKRIFDGFDIELSNGEIERFSLTIEDQLNLISLSTLAASGQNTIPYHADGKLCKYYSAEDILSIAAKATELKMYHTSYFNSLKNWVNSMTDIAKICSVAYGDQVPAEYCSDVLSSMHQAV